MRIIASSVLDLGIARKEFENNQSGLVVYPEECFTNEDITPYKKITREKPISIIGTKSTGKGHNFTYLIQNGSFSTVYVFSEPEEYNKLSKKDYYNTILTLANFRTNLDKVHNININNESINAIIRECSDIIGYRSPPGKEIADLLITSCNVDQVQNLGMIIEKHKAHICPNTLIVQAMDQSPDKTGIYDLSGTQLGVKKEGYTLYDLVR